MSRNLLTKKALTASLLALFVVASFAGWLLLREQKMTEENPKPPVAGENPTQNPGNIEPPANIDTSNWKSYRNENTGIEMKIPGNWDSLVLLTGIDGDVICFGRKGELYPVVGGEGEVNGCAVMIMPRTKDLTLEKIRKNLVSQKENAEMYYEVKSIIVDEKEAIIVSKNVDELEKKYSVVDKVSVSVALANGVVQTINLMAYKSGYTTKTDDADRDTYLTILSTINFFD